MEVGGPGGPWPLLKFKVLHRNSFFAIENHLNLAKWPPLLPVVSSASDAYACVSLILCCNYASAVSME